MGCPFGDPADWMPDLHASAVVNASGHCVIANAGGYLPIGPDERGAHTHTGQSLPKGYDRPVICIQPEEVRSDQCECGLSYLFWHEYAHVFTGHAKPDHGVEWQHVRSMLGHYEAMDISGTVQREPWSSQMSWEDLMFSLALGQAG